MKKTIYVATPSFNSVDHIDRAILSVVSQSGDFDIRYHVQDGGSDDGTVERLKWWVASLESGRFPIQCNGIQMTYVSEPDSGMYDALVRAFRHLSAPSDAFETWINSDDTLVSGAFSAVARIAETFESKEVAWLSGDVYGSNLYGINYSSLLDRPPTNGIAQGLCDGQHLPFIQQEGTFFRGWLWNKFVQEGAFQDLRLAGDWLLWTRFAQHAELFELDQPLGRFHQRAGQLSGNMAAYLGEIDSIIPESDRVVRLLELLKNTALVNLRLDWDSDLETFEISGLPTSNRRLSWLARAHKPELADQIESIVGREVDLVLEMAKYRNLLAGDLIMLVETDQLDTLDWKTALARKPWKVGFWRALKRYQRRNEQNT